MKVREVIQKFKDTNYEIVIEIPKEEGHHSFLYGKYNITEEIMNCDVCFIIPYKRLNRLIICVSNGELVCNNSMYLEVL